MEAGWGLLSWRNMMCRRMPGIFLPGRQRRKLPFSVLLEIGAAPQLAGGFIWVRR